ncbi:hypothetical protein Pcinc_012358 [Petrolisthes cinctipes]|uniref:Transposable element P transposase-like GTP-binding insertion domain-containing protein n=1 Tax=Petrolisthes cinctipes TaxID=88211 RepID=A0AAE1G1Y7_PETCI|nr:hypothetical protein Pcinc_012358 [Petrolisthes cinctipes]
MGSTDTCTACNSFDASIKNSTSYQIAVDDLTRKKEEHPQQLAQQAQYFIKKMAQRLDYFDDGQYETKRADNLRKLKPNAVPTLFAYQKVPPKFRKPPRKRRSSSTENSKPCSPTKKIRLEHGYAMVNFDTTALQIDLAKNTDGDSVNGSPLKPFNLEIIRRAHDIGLHVSSITSDMGSANQALWKSFRVVVSRYSRAVNKINHPYADVPHVIKNLKACLINRNTITMSNEIVTRFGLSSNTVNIDPVRDLATFQADKDLKLAPKLTECILTPGHFGKMKVLHALNFFSHSVSCGVRFLVEHEGRDKFYLTTAWFLEFVNKWFNLMSSRHPVMALSKCNRDVYQESVAHHESAVWVFENIAIDKGQWKTVQTGVILATSSVLELYVELLSMGHGYVLTSRFTQDCLENLFGCIRMKNPVPSCLEFRQALKIITVAQFLKCPAHGSYMEDDREFLAEFLDKSAPQDNTLCDIDKLNESLELPLSDSVHDQSQLNSLCYVVGYCISRLKRQKNLCQVASNLLFFLNNKEGFIIKSDYWRDINCTQVLPMKGRAAWTHDRFNMSVVLLPPLDDDPIQIKREKLNVLTCLFPLICRV